MTLVPKQPMTIGYNTIADGDEDETLVSVPFVPHTSICSRTNDDHRGILVAMVLTLLLGLSRYAGGGPSDGGGSLRRSAGKLVDGTATSDNCVPATGTFNGDGIYFKGASSSRPVFNFLEPGEVLLDEIIPKIRGW